MIPLLVLLHTRPGLFLSFAFASSCPSLGFSCRELIAEEVQDTFDRGVTRCRADYIMDSTDPTKGDVEKHAIGHNELLHDHDVLGNKEVRKEDAQHAAELTAEEKALERKLRIKVDIMIMPWVILVS